MLDSNSAAYGFADRLLHRVALAAPVLETSFDIERAAFGRRAASIEVRAPVFVCGLARAGTSVAVRLLYETGQFASPTYRMLPWPLAPNLASRATRRFKRDARGARGHGDGLMHDLDTPEAIEEVFWRCFEGDRYIRANGLSPIPPDSASLDAFSGYVRLMLLNSGRTRYLSKNNNNILRLAALRRRFPDARLIYPFRHPLRQAASLLRQHLRACELHRHDPFRRDFMRWLGHHEFGADQRPFLFDGHPQAPLEPASIDYWLVLWTSVYEHLLGQDDEVTGQQYFLDFERLLEQPAIQLRRFEEAVGLARETLDGGMLHAPPEIQPVGGDPALVKQALELHARLRERTEHSR